MSFTRALRLACVILCLASAAAAQERTALYGRVVGSDHERDVPPGWVVRVTAVREGSGEILDQRDSSRELYCVRVPTSARVRSQIKNYPQIAQICTTLECGGLTPHL